MKKELTDLFKNTEITDKTTVINNNKLTIGNLKIKVAS